MALTGFDSQVYQKYQGCIDQNIEFQSLSTTKLGIKNVIDR
jgi:hypothetical protein